MESRRQIIYSLDWEDSDEDLLTYAYNTDGDHKKLKTQKRYIPKKSKNQKIGNEVNNLAVSIKDFFNLHLPYIKFHEIFPFDIDTTETFNCKIFRYADVLLERDITISNHIGIKNYRREMLDSRIEHYYLPGVPKLVYEEYPLFKPDVDHSYEYSNQEFRSMFYDKFDKALRKGLQRLKKTTDWSVIESLDVFRDESLYKMPVEQHQLFGFNIYEFANVFNDRIFNWINNVYTNIIYSKPSDLTKFFHADEEVDESYHPGLNSESFRTLKAIGSVAESSYAFSILDLDTSLINKLLVHVELVNMSLGIGEGYELYFGDLNKKNFTSEDSKIKGPNFTKINNFLKIFTKCVSICLNSKTNRFIIIDYYWCAVFEIDDVFDGEVEDAQRMISKVKVKHFSFSNFEDDDEKLSIRNVIASFFYWNTDAFLEASNVIEKLNSKVIEEWTEFQKSSSMGSLILEQPQRKKLKRSPFLYRTEKGLSFTKQYVNLEKSLINFIAIGYEWSCQTLTIDLKKFYQDKTHLTKILAASKIDLTKRKDSHYLISVYDEYYQDPSISMLSRHLKNTDQKVASTKIRMIADLTYMRWLSNVEAYDKASSLQGDVIARVVDYGYMEDKPHNEKRLHFKTDGYYVIYEPIGNNYLTDLQPIDIEKERHYELAKETLAKLHKVGVSFHPHTIINDDILKYYNDKVYIINLEDSNTVVSSLNIRKDMAQLDKMFNKKSAQTSTTSVMDQVRGRRHVPNQRLFSQAEIPYEIMNRLVPQDGDSTPEGDFLSEDEAEEEIQ